MGPDPDVILGRLALGRKYLTGEQVRTAMAARGDDQSLDDVLLSEGLIDEDQRTELLEARDAFLQRQAGGTSAEDPDLTVLRAEEHGEPEHVEPEHIDDDTGATIEVDEGTAISDPDRTPGTLDPNGITIDEFVPGTGQDVEATFSDAPEDGGVGELQGQVIGGCKIGRKLGQGGMGAVYEAVHVALNKKVAIKVIATAAAPSDVLVQRFQREARAAARLQHPNIVGVFDVGRDKGFHFIQMEFIEGQSVRDAIADESLDLEESVRILRESLKGLQAAHDQDLVHRDIKPDNILISSRGEVKIADFGLARSVQEESLEITRSGQILGTPHFMSPEQCDGQKTDGRTDIYSLGVTMYTMLAGEKPFVGDTAMAILMKHIHEEPPSLRERRADVPEDLENIVMKMMAKDLGDRYASAQAVLEDLDLWDRGGRIAAPKRRRRRRSGAGLLLGVFALVLVAGVGAVAAVKGWIPGLAPPPAPTPVPGPGVTPRTETALDKAQARLNVNDHAGAIPFLEEWCNNHADDAAAQALLKEARFRDAFKTGQDLIFQSRFDDAIEALRKAVEYAPSEKLRSDAQEQLDRSTAERDKHARRADVDRAMSEANGHMRAGRWDLALAAIERVLAVDAEHPMARALKRTAERNARASAALTDAAEKLQRVDQLLSDSEDESAALPVLDTADALLSGVADDVRDEERLAAERTRLGDQAQRLRRLAAFLTVRKSASAAETGERWLAAAEGYDRAAEAAPDADTGTAMRAKATNCRHRQADVFVAQGDAALGNNDIAGALTAWRRALSLRPDPELAGRTRTLAERAATPEGMVYIPAGPYAPGSPSSHDDNPEGPSRELPSCYLGQTEVTNAEYAAFVSAGGYTQEKLWDPAGWAAIGTFVDRSGKPGPSTWTDGHHPSDRAKHPVIGVSWYEARAYARWRKMRLPTEIEWERAAAYDAATGRKRDYAWGDDWRDGFAAVGGAFDATHPVGTHPRDRSPAGLLDVCGNAHEWTQEADDPGDATTAVARGGAVGTPKPDATCRLLRRRVRPRRDFRAGPIGIRLAGDPDRTEEGR